MMLRTLALPLALFVVFAAAPEAEAVTVWTCFPDYPACCPRGDNVVWTDHRGHNACLPVPETP